MSYTSDYFTLFIASKDRVIGDPSSYRVQINAPFLTEERGNPDVFYEVYLERMLPCNTLSILTSDATEFLQVETSLAQPFKFVTGSKTLKNPTFIVPINSYARASIHPIVVSKQCINGMLEINVRNDQGALITPSFIGLTPPGSTVVYEHVMQLVFKRVHNLGPGL